MMTETFTDIFREFTKSFSETHSLPVKGKAPVPEKVIRCVWNEQLFKTQRVTTVDGKTLEIVSPGEWNFGGGPDFKKAEIRVDGKLFAGDVEVNMYRSDGKAPVLPVGSGFDQVILHVFMWKKEIGEQEKEEKSIRPPAKAGPFFEIELKPYLNQGILTLNSELDFESYPHSKQSSLGLCHEPLTKLPPEKFEHLLNVAGDARAQTKMERFSDRTIIDGYEQTFYEGVSEALGYPNNKIPFRQLAERMPLAELKKRMPAGLNETQAVEWTQAMLFGVSGLIDWQKLDLSSLPPDDKNYFENLKNNWSSHEADFREQVLSRKEWKFGRIRPANFPYRRIAGLSHLLVSYGKSGIFGSYLKYLQSSISILGENEYTERFGKRIFEFFCVEFGGYWSHYYTPGGKRLGKAQRLIGPDRSREISVNIGIPIGLIYSRASKSAALEKFLRLLFQTRIKPADNKWIRFMKSFLLGSKPEMLSFLGTEQRTQGLMQIYQDYCAKNKNNCETCQFPGVVDKFFS